VLLGPLYLVFSECIYFRIRSSPFFSVPSVDPAAWAGDILPFLSFISPSARPRLKTQRTLSLYQAPLFPPRFLFFPLRSVPPSEICPARVRHTVLSSQLFIAMRELPLPFHPAVQKFPVYPLYDSQIAFLHKRSGAFCKTNFLRCSLCRALSWCFSRTHPCTYFMSPLNPFLLGPPSCPIHRNFCLDYKASRVSLF